MSRDANRKLVVLLVDDEAPVATATRRMLQRHHEVTVASSVEEALALLAKTSFDVVVSDYEMLPLGGEVLLAEVAKTYPSARRILYSGSPKRHLAGHLAHAVVDKPATMAELEAALTG